MLEHVMKWLPAIPVTAALNVVAHSVYRDAYRVFGLQPEDVGLTDLRVGAQVVGIAAIIAGLVVASIQLVRAQVWLVAATDPAWQRAPDLPPELALRLGAAAIIPPMIVWLLPLAVPEGWVRELIRSVLAAGTIGFWLAAAFRSAISTSLIAWSSLPTASRWGLEGRLCLASTDIGLPRGHWPVVSA